MENISELKIENCTSNMQLYIGVLQVFNSGAIASICLGEAIC